MNWTQQDAPLMDALKEHLMNRVVRFDVPGHKGGRGNHELADFLGERIWTISATRFLYFGMHSSLQRRRLVLQMLFSLSTAQPVHPRQ